MNVSIGSHWEEFVNALVQSGRYGSASEVIRDALRLVEAREAKLKSLRDSIEASIAEGGRHTAEEVREFLRRKRDERAGLASAAE